MLAAAQGMSFTRRYIAIQTAMERWTIVAKGPQLRPRICDKGHEDIDVSASSFWPVRDTDGAPVDTAPIADLLRATMAKCASCQEWCIEAIAGDFVLTAYLHLMTYSMIDAVGAAMGSSAPAALDALARTTNPLSMAILRAVARESWQEAADAALQAPLSARLRAVEDALVLQAGAALASKSDWKGTRT